MTVTGRSGGDTDIQRNRPVNGFDDIEQRSLRAAGKKQKTSHDSAPGLNQAGAGKGLKDLGKEAFRRFRRLGQNCFGDDCSLVAGWPDEALRERHSRRHGLVAWMFTIIWTYLVRNEHIPCGFIFSVTHGTPVRDFRHVFAVILAAKPRPVLPEQDAKPRLSPANANKSSSF